MRAIWSGEVGFGLVAIPAKLYSATKDLTPSFNQLHKECGTRISMVRRCPKCERDLAWDEIGKGYEVTKGQYALFTKEELAAMEGEDGAGGIDIVEFVDPKEIDLAYVEKSYWVGPAGKSSRSFQLLRQVLDQTGKVALAKVKIRTRTRLGLLRPRGRLFSLEMMRFADELVGADDIDMPDAAKVPTEREVQLALGLVEQLTGPFDPGKHPDQYRAAIEAAVEQKVEANQVLRDEATEEQRTGATTGAQVIDLADLLARSMKAAENTTLAPRPPAKAEPRAAKAETKAEKAAAEEKAPKKKKRAS
jgi:DNA end-binding protein Ku